jgi:transglutaminase-like putative cysteine protease
MQVYKILHRTYYNFSTSVRLGPHALRLRPREGPELRIESAVLTTTPVATFRWHRDVEDNAVAVANFDSFTSQLLIESEVIVQQHAPVFLDPVETPNHAAYPFAYAAEDEATLSPYRDVTGHTASERARLAGWVGEVWQSGGTIQAHALLLRLAAHIHRTVSYRLREEPGVQTVADTLSHRTGSCRDSAFLFMVAARSLGFAARFVSGYLDSPPSAVNFGATHAWAEVFLPGVGWTGFDPTVGSAVGADHIAVAVARSPESVPPVSGTFIGPPGSSLDVGVWVTPLPP